ncbi:energy transducer TonB [Chryseobacterium sp. POL2]|uniref:energy transducer TonB n=1 Tax=Chryseobacterium sp. POL2 TaxID=2713414 RepID=UPI0013E17056|nr:energy transducer TonB [Chryseobacterium sp. POL2]QIG90566.1 energy transducer TonB [Chryseobacterium sp. POL2]
MENLLKELRKRSLGLDEVVFEHRNKAYGAYQLRHNYGSNLSKAMFVGIGLFVSVAALPFIINAFKTDSVVVDVFPPTGPFILDDVETPDVPMPPPASAPQQQQVKTVEFVMPTPTRAPKIQKTVPTATEIETTTIGTTTTDGPVSPNVYIPIAPPNIGTGDVPAPPIVQPAIPVKNPDAILDKVDVEASFKGGVEAFRRIVGERFDTSVLDQSGTISAIVTFVVEKDGRISNVKAKGKDADFNREAERTIKDIKTKWTPAKLEGQVVRSYFRIPISMRVE